VTWTLATYRHVPSRGQHREALASTMANDRDPRSDLGAYLGEELRHARLGAGIDSQELLARELGFDRTVIVKAETGSTPPSRDVAPKIAARFPELCNGLYVALAEIARKSNGPIPGWFADWPGKEAEARTLRAYEPLLVPGLLQTERYAYALLRTRVGDSDEEIGEMVSARMERQAILARDKPPTLWVIVDEGVLHRPIGGADVMHEQLGHLAQVARWPRVVLQVVPTAVGAYEGLRGPLVIADFEDAPSVVYLDTAVRGQIVEGRDDIDAVRVTWDTLMSEALSRSASLDLVEEVGKTWT
jgi:DNA-binding XRE family transcriptional regulator